MGRLRAYKAMGLKKATLLDREDDRFTRERGDLKFSGVKMPVVTDPKTDKFKNHGTVTSAVWKFC
jgi:hypothetical protein